MPYILYFLIGSATEPRVRCARELGKFKIFAGISMLGHVCAEFESIQWVLVGQKVCFLKYFLEQQIGISDAMS